MHCLQSCNTSMLLVTAFFLSGCPSSPSAPGLQFDKFRGNYQLDALQEGKVKNGLAAYLHPLKIYDITDLKTYKVSRFKLRVCGYVLHETRVSDRKSLESLWFYGDLTDDASGNWRFLVGFFGEIYGSKIKINETCSGVIQP